MKVEERFLGMMINAIKVISSDFDTQVKSYPDFVVVPDEVVSTFGEAFLLFPQVIDAGLINDEQIKAVYAIEVYLEKMNRKKEEENLWTLEAMEKHSSWQILRSLAKKALFLFGSSENSSNLYWATYVRGKKKPE